MLALERERREAIVDGQQLRLCRQLWRIPQKIGHAQAQGSRPARREELAEGRVLGQLRHVWQSVVGEEFGSRRERRSVGFEVELEAFHARAEPSRVANPVVGVQRVNGKVDVQIELELLARPVAPAHERRHVSLPQLEQLLVQPGVEGIQRLLVYSLPHAVPDRPPRGRLLRALAHVQLQRVRRAIAPRVDQVLEHEQLELIGH
mmetsp:Transcript_201/g.533  ORF Transcript_201/g.533 Transcript_201/m.533 type:complete len:204 (-) Transcript_201:55-666(-)